MKMVCPLCQGSGVMIILPTNIAIPKMDPIALAKSGEKKVCHLCKGAGEIETGFLYREMVARGDLK